jgi:uncharacterized membrane protein
MFTIPDPLHPAVVHLPLGLAVVLPLFALALAVAIARGRMPTRSWAFVAALHLLLVGGAWAALETGEEEEERVEDVVPKDAVHEHQDRAELFLWFSVGALALTGAGLLAGPVGGVARGAAVVATFVVLGLAIRTGDAGGHLVYEHDAAKAYLSDRVPHTHGSGETRPPHDHADEPSTGGGGTVREAPAPGAAPLEPAR